MSDKPAYPITQAGFVRWCKETGRESILVGSYQHDIRNIRKIAKKYGYEWDESTNPRSILLTELAMHLESEFPTGIESELELPDWVKEAEISSSFRHPEVAPRGKLTKVKTQEPSANPMWGAW